MQASANAVGMRPTAVGLVLVMLFGAALAACRDECPATKTKCVGNELWTCPPYEDGPHHWGKQDCGARVCVTAEVPDSPGWVKSFCAFETEPRPACAGAMRACDGPELLACEYGFVIGAQTCASAEHCAAGLNTLGLCPLAVTRDPRCDSAELVWRSAYACDGALSIECWVDFAVSELDCGATGCVDGICGTDGPSDARCQAAAAAHPEWPVQVTCDENVALVCSGEHLLYQSTCGLLTCVPGGPPNDLNIAGYCG